MEVRFQTLLSQNITLVYESLEPRNIDSGRLKKLLGPRITPTLMDTPEMIVVVYPPKPTIVQIGDRRIRVTVPEASEQLGDPPIWDYAFKLNKVVSKPQIKLLAYGFNYDLGFEADQKGVQTAITSLFLREQLSVSESLGGEVSIFIPRFKYERDSILYDLVVEALDELRIKVHLNVHFEYKDKPPPTRSQLRKTFFSEYEYLENLIPELLQFQGKE